MINPWTSVQDELLIRNQSVGPWFVSAMGIGKTSQTGEERLEFLNENGATLLIAKAKLMYLEAMSLAGTAGSTNITQQMHQEEIQYWQGFVEELQPVAKLEVVR